MPETKPYKTRFTNASVYGPMGDDVVPMTRHAQEAIDAARAVSVSMARRIPISDGGYRVLARQGAK